jgi:hypothetical protein
MIYQLVQGHLFLHSKYFVGDFLRVKQVVALVAFKAVFKQHMDVHVEVSFVSLFSPRLLQPLLLLEPIEKLKT